MIRRCSDSKSDEKRLEFVEYVGSVATLIGDLILDVIPRTAISATSLFWHINYLSKATSSTQITAG